MRKIDMKKDMQAIEIEKNFFENVQIDPKFGYDSRYKYKSFYLEDSTNYERYGVMYVYCKMHEEGSFKYKHETIDLKCYSALGGDFEIHDIEFHAGKNYINELDPIIYYRASCEENYSVMKYDYVYNKSELIDVLVIYSKLKCIDKMDQVFNIYFNFNGTIKHYIENVISYNYLNDMQDTILYQKKDSEKKYSFYIYNYQNNETTFLGKQNSKDIYEAGLKTNRIAGGTLDTKRKIIKGNKVYVYFSLDSSIGSDVFMEHLKCADGVDEINNIIKYDATRNYSAWFNKNRLTDIQFTLYLVHKFNIKGFKLFDYDVQYLANVVDYGSKIYRYYIQNEYKAHYEKLKQVNKIVKDEFKLSDTGLINLYKNEFGGFSIDRLTSRIRPYIEKLEIEHPEGLNKNIKKGYDEKIKELYNLVALEKNNIRWKSEISLYKLVEIFYPDAEYQHRTEWLGKQSIDIYIKQHNIAIEYQGEQHYKPIDIFGGEEKFRDTIRRDETKRKLCLEHGVKLIEWKYDIPINVLNLKELFSEKGIKINLEKVIKKG